MKITKSELREMIKEELLNEVPLNMRDSFYQTGDWIGNLDWLSKRHTEFHKDRKLKDFVNKLYKAHDMLKKHLDKNYEWD